MLEAPPFGKPERSSSVASLVPSHAPAGGPERVSTAAAATGSGGQRRVGGGGGGTHVRVNDDPLLLLALGRALGRGVPQDSSDACATIDRRDDVVIVGGMGRCAEAGSVVLH